VTDPDVPVFDVKQLSLVAALVIWHPANRSGERWLMPGASFQANYSEEGGPWIESETITLPSTSIELHGLVVDQDYQIVGIARDGSRSTQSPPLVFRLRSPQPVSHISHGADH
jgi:hypothetical protein